MIPILREYVEILFAEKLLKVVFATETLAIGINMPAKCVVFTSLEKPSGKNGEMTSLRPEQFMQMSGRAGRRGMDEKGFVVYYPIRSSLTEAEFRHLLFGKMPSAQSQLSISPLFVLKNLQSADTNVLEKTLLHHQQQRYIKALQTELDKLPVVPQELIEKVEKYESVKDRMNGMFRLTQSQRKECEREITELALDDTTIKHVTNRIKLEKEIRQQENALSNDWKTSVDWLHGHGYIESDENRLTLLGKISSGLSDGLPLVRGVMIDCLKEASFEKFAGWLGCFTESIRVSRDAVIDQESLDEMNPILDKIQQTAEAYHYENDETLHDDQYNTGLLLYLWATHKDMSQIYGYIGSGQLGTFIKAVLRVISYMEEIKKVLLGLQYYELYNRLDHHQERLMDGLVTNQSLYVK
jgi:superfamily II RNA helicase